MFTRQLKPPIPVYQAIKIGHFQDTRNRSTPVARVRKARKPCKKSSFVVICSRCRPSPVALGNAGTAFECAIGLKHLPALSLLRRLLLRGVLKQCLIQRFVEALDGKHI